jgi:hypothetical protein
MSYNNGLLFFPNRQIFNLYGDRVTRKRLKYYREVPGGYVIKKNNFQATVLDLKPAKIVGNPRVKMNAKQLARFDKLVNAQVDTYIYNNFPWEKSIVTVRQHYTMLVPVEVSELRAGTAKAAFATWFNLYSAAYKDKLRPAAFWKGVTDKLVSGGYASENGAAVNNAAIAALLQRIQELYAN